MTWPRVPTRRLFRVVNGGTPTSDPRNWEGHIKWATPIDLALVNGGLIEGTQRTITPIGLTSGSRSVPEKSLILSTRAPIGYIAETVTQTAFNQGCRGLVPQVKVDTRYFRYQYGVIADQLGAQGLGATFMELSSESLAASKVSAPSLSTQRAIADFLDVETAGIEALIAKKRLMLQLLIERSAGIVEWKVRELVKRHGEQRLKTAVRDVTVGIVVTPSVWYADHGVPAIRGLNVRPYKIDLSDLVKLSAEGHRIHAKSRLHAGDVVVVRTGQAGAAAVVPSELDDTNCIDLLIVRPAPLDARFLVYVLNSDWTRKHISKYSVGTIQSHFNVSALAELPIPVPPLDEQRQFVVDIVTQLAKLEAVQAKLRNQLELLQEHRQALITAAVTGEMDVPGVST